MSIDTEQFIIENDVLASTPNDSVFEDAFTSIMDSARMASSMEGLDSTGIVNRANLLAVTDKNTRAVFRQRVNETFTGVDRIAASHLISIVERGSSRAMFQELTNNHSGIMSCVLPAFVIISSYREVMNHETVTAAAFSDERIAEGFNENHETLTNLLDGLIARMVDDYFSFMLCRSLSAVRREHVVSQWKGSISALVAQLQSAASKSLFDTQKEEDANGKFASTVYALLYTISAMAIQRAHNIRVNIIENG